jgi:DNA gyrase subunit A
MPYNAPNDCWAFDWEEGNEGYKYWFEGEVDVINATTVHITKLPHGILHEAYVNGTPKTPGVLDKLLAEGTIVNYEDSSAQDIDIMVKFKRGHQPKDYDELLGELGLVVGVTELFTIIDFDGTTVWQPSVAEYIEAFTDWRLKWYKDRYQRLKNLLEIDMQKYLDILTAIRRDVSGEARTMVSRSTLKTFLFDINIVYVDYIADLPVYRFTKAEKQKVEDKLEAARKMMAWYNKLLAKPQERKKIYEQELLEILGKYKKKAYVIAS